MTYAIGDKVRLHGWSGGDAYDGSTGRITGFVTLALPEPQGFWQVRLDGSSNKNEAPLPTLESEMEKLT